MQSFQTLIKPSLDNKGYWLKCRFSIEREPNPRYLYHATMAALEAFIRDMHQQGWEHDGRVRPQMKGPFPYVAPVQIKMPRALRAKDMAALVAKGERFLDSGEDTASIMPELDCTEFWDFELRAVFVRPTILVEIPDPHEEMN
jgi:hypothetical protein